MFNYLQTESDRREVIEALSLTREILAQKAFEPYDDGEISPGADVTSDEEVLAWAPRHRRDRVPPHQHLHHGHR